MIIAKADGKPKAGEGSDNQIIFGLDLEQWEALSRGSGPGEHQEIPFRVRCRI